MKTFILFFSLIMAFVCTVQAEHNNQDMKIFAYNAAVGTTAEGINAQGDALVFPTRSQKYTVVSEKPDDAAAGTGARTIKITGLNAELKQIEEIVSMNGTTGVNTTKDFRFIQSAEVSSFGSSKKNAGAITIVGVTEHSVIVIMNKDVNRTYMAAYMQPAGSSGALKALHIGVRTEDTTITVQKIHKSGIKTDEHSVVVAKDTTYTPPAISLPDLKPGDIVSIIGVASANTSYVTCYMEV